MRDNKSFEPRYEGSRGVWDPALSVYMDMRLPTRRAAPMPSTCLCSSTWSQTDELEEGYPGLQGATMSLQPLGSVFSDPRTIPGISRTIPGSRVLQGEVSKKDTLLSFFDQASLQKERGEEESQLPKEVFQRNQGHAADAMEANRRLRDPMVPDRGSRKSWIRRSGLGAYTFLSSRLSGKRDDH